ncbi:hypothetical protein [Neobacillus bataviensis]|uniref:hypothetical protein n=1 Tax=Neobacillus bataviensis TaxID=220685 RepID=UPI001CBB8154|nr:hypothetical protein [Neobacillus bataviensis]
MPISLVFFETWKKLFPQEMANRRKYVSSLTGFQIALSLTIFKLTKYRPIPHLEAIQQLRNLKNYC